MKKSKYSDLATYLSVLHRSNDVGLPLICVVEDSFERETLYNELSLLIKGRVELSLSEVLHEASSFSLFSEGKFLVLLGEDDDLPLVQQALSKEVPVAIIASKKLEIPHDEAFTASYVEILGPKPWDKQKRICSFLQYYFFRLGKKLTKEAMAVLGEAFTGSDEPCTQECEKLLMYVGQAPEITLQDVQAIVTLKTTSTLWSFWQALVDGDDVALFTAFDAVVDDEVHPLQIVRFIRTQISSVIKFIENPDGEESKSKFKSESAQKLSLRFSLEELRKIFSTINDLEFQMKNSEGDPKLLLELFLTRLCSSYCLIS